MPSQNSKRDALLTPRLHSHHQPKLAHQL